jgi:hypothetical protein
MIKATEYRRTPKRGRNFWLHIKRLRFWSAALLRRSQISRCNTSLGNHRQSGIAM